MSWKSDGFSDIIALSIYLYCSELDFRPFMAWPARYDWLQVIMWNIKNECKDIILIDLTALMCPYWYNGQCTHPICNTNHAKVYHKMAKGQKVQWEQTHENTYRDNNHIVFIDTIIKCLFWSTKSVFFLCLFPKSIVVKYSTYPYKYDY